jgi:hypothetical protein
MAMFSSRARFAAAACLLAAIGVARAADAPSGTRQVNFVTPVVYADEATAKPAVREHCELEKAVQADVIEALRKSGRTVNEVATKDSGETLGVTIQRMQGMGPFTGPKYLSLMAHTYRDGKSTHLKMLGDRSIGLPLQGTCGILQHISKNLAGQLATWLDELDAAAAAAPVATAASDAAH